MDLHTKGFVPYWRVVYYPDNSDDRSNHGQDPVVVTSWLGIGYLHDWIYRGTSVLGDKIHSRTRRR